jgi:hypothetical protein
MGDKLLGPGWLQKEVRRGRKKEVRIKKTVKGVYKTYSLRRGREMTRKIA